MQVGKEQTKLLGRFINMRCWIRCSIIGLWMTVTLSRATREWPPPVKGQNISGDNSLLTFEMLVRPMTLREGPY
jgi:hypothetical protein